MGENTLYSFTSVSCFCSLYFVYRFLLGTLWVVDLLWQHPPLYPLLFQQKDRQTDFEKICECQFEFRGR
jgi:hypothetical protein